MHIHSAVPGLVPGRGPRAAPRWITIVVGALLFGALVGACSGSSAAPRREADREGREATVGGEERTAEITDAEHTEITDAEITAADTGDEPSAEEEASVEPEVVAPSAARTVRLGASGDLLAHIRVVSAARGHGGFEHVLGPLRDAIRPDEIAFLNLETPLSEERPVLSGSPPILGAPPEVANVLAAIGVDVVSLANNHAWDQYSIGAGRTLEALASANVVAIGAGPDLDAAFAPRIVLTEDGTRVAFVGVTERVNGGPGPLGPSTLIARWADDAPILAAVERARTEADLVVVSVHWSHDFRMLPFGAQREHARLLVEHGADVILGHGPHVLQEVERLPSPRGEAVCAYSLGNLVSNQGFRYVLGRHGARGANPAIWMPEARDGAWLRVTATLEGGRIAIAPVTAVPLFTYNNYFARERERGVVEDIRIQLLRDVADEDLRAARMRVIAETLGPHVTLE